MMTQQPRHIREDMTRPFLDDDGEVGESNLLHLATLHLRADFAASQSLGPDESMSSCRPPSRDWTDPSAPLVDVDLPAERILDEIATERENEFLMKKESARAEQRILLEEVRSRKEQAITDRTSLEVQKHNAQQEKRDNYANYKRQLKEEYEEAQALRANIVEERARSRSESEDSSRSTRRKRQEAVRWFSTQRNALDKATRRIEEAKRKERERQRHPPRRAPSPNKKS
eukprot:GHVU01215711.1.p1 GENE.GHVU01215711.1~~GHVU01215711.1.p1  ORF type:complete len:229 (+),score=34.86 GHVU01215711.1:1771-2457(+)